VHVRVQRIEREQPQAVIQGILRSATRFGVRHQATVDASDQGAEPLALDRQPMLETGFVD
jgi:hypothetical protein